MKSESLGGEGAVGRIEGIPIHLKVYIFPFLGTNPYVVGTVPALQVCIIYTTISLAVTDNVV